MFAIVLMLYLTVTLWLLLLLSLVIVVFSDGCDFLFCCPLLAFADDINLAEQDFETVPSVTTSKKWAKTIGSEVQRQSLGTGRLVQRLGRRWNVGTKHHVGLANTLCNAKRRRTGLKQH